MATVEGGEDGGLKKNEKEIKVEIWLAGGGGGAKNVSTTKRSLVTNINNKSK